MTLAEIKNQIMFQTNNDEDDLPDFMPHLLDYINDGYDKLVKVWTKSHLVGDYQPLSTDTDVPLTPEWTHRAICDWATWLVYRNGNPQKQQRGMAFRAAFEEVISKILQEGGASGLNADGTSKQYQFFINIPR